MTTKHTPGPWRWADWSVDFGTFENVDRMCTLEHNETHEDVVVPVLRTRQDGCHFVLRVEDPIENEYDRELIRRAPELRDALYLMIRMFEGSMPRSTYEKFHKLTEGV